MAGSSGDTLFIFIIILLTGSCIGSFLNVCIHRIPLKKSIVFPPSSCPGCNRKIPFYCNIPVFSYLMLKGRCKFCKMPISARYPLIEMLTGAMGALLFLNFGLTMVTLFWFVFICFLIVISFIDIDHQIIPDILSLPGILLFASSAFFLPEMNLKSTLTGIALGGGSLYAVALLYYLIRKKEGMGGGDIKLLAMIGGAVGAKGVFFTIFSASLAGTLTGALLMMWYRGTSPGQLKIPFGPFLSLGATCYIFWGEKAIHWYIYLLNG